MNIAGYSGKSLITKLGYLSGERVLIIDGPTSFTAYLKENSIATIETLPVEWQHVFFTTQTDLERWARATDFSQVSRGVWVSWPKKRSGVQSNITEQSFRDTLLPLSLVDVKVAAIDDTWSGLKFVRRKS